MVDLSTTISGLRMKNPTMLASGILGESGESLFRIAGKGAGAVVTKSIGMEPKIGHKNPSFVEMEHGVLNAMGLPNPGIEAFSEEVSKAVASGIPVLGSIFGKDKGEFITLARKMEEYGVQGLELNLSCPHAKGYGAELGHDRNIVREITEAVKNAVRIPVFPKLSPNVESIADIALAVEEAGGEGVVVINTMKAVAINAELAMPVLANAVGGLSGPAIKPIGLRCVYEIRKGTELPIIGVGGVITGRDAVEYFMAGASAVQIGSGIYYRGRDVFTLVCGEIEKFMEKQGYESIEEMVGIAVKK
ncbi:MAG: dihydroorotate dehydrogenase [Thermoplasmata archaeon]|nr:MAG: dihydroorotate dehydrogenase [Thermoplasmata archaeon]